MGRLGEETPCKDDPPVAPELSETLRQIGITGRASLSAVGDTAKSLRALVAADVSLARSALGRSLAMTGVAIVCGASSWLFMMAALVVFLNGVAGWSWPTAMLIPAALSLAITCFASWRAAHFFEHTRMDATRRQLARLGIGELSELMPSPDSAHSARDAASGQVPREPPVTAAEAVNNSERTP